MAVGGQWIYNDYRYRGINNGYHGSSSSGDYTMWGLIASAVAGFASAAVNLYSTWRNNQIASSQYSQQYRLQKDALYNGHQIETADMAKAGLNPILSGSGASTSQVSTASNQPASSPDLLSPLLNAYSQHENLNLQREQFGFDKHMREQELTLEKDKTRADVLKSLSQSNLSNAQIEQVLENLGLIRAQKENVQKDTEVKQKSLEVSDAQINKINAEIKNIDATRNLTITKDNLEKVNTLIRSGDLSWQQFQNSFWKSAGIPPDAASSIANSKIGAAALSAVLSAAGIASKNATEKIASGLQSSRAIVSLQKELAASKAQWKNHQIVPEYVKSNWKKLENQISAHQEAIDSGKAAFERRNDYNASSY